MAAPAETATLSTETFDWQTAELQFGAEAATQAFDWRLAEAQFSDFDEQSLVDAASLAMLSLEHRLSGSNDWLAVDRLPSLRQLRTVTDIESAMILEHRQEQLREGDFDSVPYAFNVLGTAHKLLEAERLHGINSDEYRQLYKGFYLDSKRHRDEARRRLTWEYFPPVEQQFDAAADSYVYGGYNLKTVVDNGLSPVGSEAVGIDVLIANRREEYTSAAVHKLGKLMIEHNDIKLPEKKLSMLTVSQIDTSPQTMIWVAHLDPLNNRRFQEQVGFTKEYITNDVIAEAFRRQQVVVADAQPTEQQILGTQVLSLEGEGALGIMPLLDQIASEQSGVNIFMGEMVSDNFMKDYAGIPEQAAARQAENEDEIDALMAEVLRLARNDTDGFLANRLIDDFVTNMLLDKVENDPETARQIFGDETADNLGRALIEQQYGNIDEANRIRSDARANAPTATVCTGSECGLQQVNRATVEGQKLAKELKAEAGDTIVVDKVRPCKDCGKKTLAYAYNHNKVNTRCTNRACKGKRFESKISKVKPQLAA